MILSFIVPVGIDSHSHPHPQAAVAAHYQTDKLHCGVLDAREIRAVDYILRL
jgi:hypothetical protein